MTRYRCNEFGHLCLDRSSDPPKSIQPPETAPLDAPGAPTAPTLTLTDCESLDEDGLLTPVSTLVSGIKALKADPDRQIFVGAIVAPPAPYTVDWVAPVGGQNLRQGELWPQVEHSCGSNDGSSGEPAVRITQLVKEFGDQRRLDLDLRSQSTGYASLLSGLASEDRRSPPERRRRCFDLLRRRWLGRRSGAGGSGTTVGDAGAVGPTGAGGTTGITGTGASVQLGAGGKGPDGLRHGGCDVGSSGSGAWGLLLTGLFLLGARRRRLLTANIPVSKADRKVRAAWTSCRPVGHRVVAAHGPHVAHSPDPSLPRRSPGWRSLSGWRPRRVPSRRSIRPPEPRPLP